MQLLAQEEYGLRCLVQVARHRGSDPLTIPEIASREGISPEYVAKLMRALRQTGFVVSTRGAGGGYRLARPAHEITAWQAIQALGGSLFPAEFCDAHPGQLLDCVHSTGCSLRGLWSSVESAIRVILEGTTVADLARDDAVLLGIDAPPDEAKTRATQ